MTMKGFSDRLLSRYDWETGRCNKDYAVMVSIKCHGGKKMKNDV